MGSGCKASADKIAVELEKLAVGKSPQAIM
jgi:hypothetical protein